MFDTRHRQLLPPRVQPMERVLHGMRVRKVPIVILEYVLIKFVSIYNIFNLAKNLHGLNGTNLHDIFINYY